jgi:hypothetical protein
LRPLRLGSPGLNSVSVGDRIEIKVQREVPVPERGPYAHFLIEEWVRVPVIYADPDFLAFKLDGQTRSLYRRGSVAWRWLPREGA